MEKEYTAIPVWDIITHLNQLLGKTEGVRKPLVEGDEILRRQIMTASKNEWLKGETPRCKRENAMSSDASDLRKVRDAIETLADKMHLLQELEKCGFDYAKFSKKYEQIG